MKNHVEMKKKKLKGDCANVVFYGRVVVNWWIIKILIAFFFF